MDVHVFVRSAEDPMFMPVRFANPQYITNCFQLAQINGFVRGVFDHDKNVDDWFGREPWH